jgi:hypothetical protein
MRSFTVNVVQIGLALSAISLQIAQIVNLAIDASFMLKVSD